MGQVTVRVGGRNYPLACKDGDEELIASLAARVDAKAVSLQEQIGHVGEVRLLLMTAIMLAEDLGREDGASGAAEGEAAEAKAAEALARASERIESIAAELEAAGLETGGPTS